MRTTVAHRYAETLGAAEHHVGTEFSRRLQYHQTHQIGGDHGNALLGVQRCNRGFQVTHAAVAGGVLENCAEHIVLWEVGDVANDQAEAERLGTGLDDVNSLREALLIDEESLAAALADAFGHGHRFCGGGRFIEQRGVGQIHAGQVQNHLLEGQQGFEAALRDFRLVRRVGGVPARILQHVAGDDIGCQRVVVAEADEGAGRLVGADHRLEAAQHLLFGGGLAQCQRSLEGNGLRHRHLDQLLQRCQLQLFQHRANVGLVRANVTADKFVAVLQTFQCPDRWILSIRSAANHG